MSGVQEVQGFGMYVLGCRVLGVGGLGLGLRRLSVHGEEWTNPCHKPWHLEVRFAPVPIFCSPMHSHECINEPYALLRVQEATGACRSSTTSGD